MQREGICLMSLSNSILSYRVRFLVWPGAKAQEISLFAALRSRSIWQE